MRIYLCSLATCRPNLLPEGLQSRLNPRYYFTTLLVAMTPVLATISVRLICPITMIISSITKFRSSCDSCSQPSYLDLVECSLGVHDDPRDIFWVVYEVRIIQRLQLEYPVVPIVSCCDDSYSSSVNSVINNFISY